MSKQSTEIRLIVGLGNHGSKYEETRHNAGFWLVDEIARRHGGMFRPEKKFHGEVCLTRISGRECWLLKPATYMNRSGLAVSSLANYFKIEAEQMLVAHDELDMEPGVVRLKKGGGHAGHNGLRDIISAINSRDFWRLRIGIDHPGDARQVSDYVLSRPSREDRERIEDGLDRAIRLLPQIITGESQKVMNQLHSSR
jgi:PTH1 family peptidyl-tRNA hydrolase